MQDLSLCIWILLNGSTSNNCLLITIGIYLLHILKLWSFRSYALHTIVTRKSHICKALSYLLLLSTMYLLCLIVIYKVARTYTSAILQFLGNRMLGSTEISPLSAIHIIIPIRWKLYRIYRQLVIRLIPHLTPKACHGLETLDILLLISHV